MQQNPRPEYAVFRGKFNHAVITLGGISDTLCSRAAARLLRFWEVTIKDDSIRAGIFKDEVKLSGSVINGISNLNSDKFLRDLRAAQAALHGVFKERWSEYRRAPPRPSGAFRECPRQFPF